MLIDRDRMVLEKSNTQVFMEEDLKQRIRDMDLEIIHPENLKHIYSTDKNFRKDVFEIIMDKLGVDSEEFLDTLKSQEIDNFDLKNLITDQNIRVQELVIDYFIWTIPFVYLKNYFTTFQNLNNATLKERDIFKFIKDDTINFRKVIISEIQKDIIRAENVSESLEVISKTIESKSQVQKFKNIQLKSGNKRNKFIAELQFIQSILDEMSKDKLNSLISDYMKVSHMIV